MGFIAKFQAVEKLPKAVKRTVGGKVLKTKTADGREVDMIDPDLSEDGVIRCLAGGTDQVTRTVHHSCSVRINGKDSQLTDLKSGDLLDMDGQPAITILASRPVAPGAPQPADTRSHLAFASDKS